jgi:hypothetical protein
VLAVGGNVLLDAQASAELFDPATGTWTMTGSLPGPRSDHTATLLPNGKVLVAGGTDGMPDGINNLSSAVLYDPASGTWTTTASLSSAHSDHGATLLPNGKVLVMGGDDITSFATAVAEVYDPGLGFSAASQPQITSVSLLSSGSGVKLSGSNFRGISEASSGSSQDSPADYPVLELMSLDGGHALFLLVTNWSADSITSAPVSSLPPGYLMARVFVNGIGSAGKIFKNPPVPDLVNLPNQFSANMLPPSMGPGGVTVSFAGSAGVTYSVLRASTLTGPWTTMTTVTVGSSGIGSYADPNPPATKAFYRTVHQQ